MNKKSGEEKRFLSHFSKTDFRYWNETVFRKGYTKGGRQHFTKDWYARIQHDGRRDFFSLQTPNKAAAASRAKDIYLYCLLLCPFLFPGATKGKLSRKTVGNNGLTLDESLKCDDGYSAYKGAHLKKDHWPIFSSG